jgi:hypothetical protein
MGFASKGEEHAAMVSQEPSVPREVAVADMTVPASSRTATRLEATSSDLPACKRSPATLWSKNSTDGLEDVVA